MTDLTSEQQFAVALAAFQAELPVIKKDHKASVKSEKGSYSYAYSPLEDISPVAMPLLAKNGLSFTSRPMMTDHGFVLRYALLHTAGHREEGDFPLADPSKFDAQKIGSWLTYARRYALCAVTGIAPGGDDDDAAKAGDARAAEFQAPHRAQRRSRGEVQPAADDPWTTAEPAKPAEPERVTDVAWIDDFRTRITLATRPSELRGLEAEANVQWADHKLSRDDAAALKREMTQREAELKGDVA